MSRLPTISARAVRLAVAALMIGLAVPAFAQEASPRPELDSVPHAVWYRSDAKIKGHLENGSPGDEVTLQHKKPGDNWGNLKRREIDEAQRVRFRVADLRTTKVFRLKWVDELTDQAEFSDWKRVRVRPRLTLELKPRHAFQGATVRLKGTMLPQVNGRKVVIKRKSGGDWVKVAKAAAGDGTYSIPVDSGATGRRRFKVVFTGDKLNRPRLRAGVLKVYDPDPATWYGPGLYGNGTACGKTLRRKTLGVAHRSLPCGTMVSIVFHGRSITVPVIDRGPYTSAEWDLTQETAERIGFSGSQTVGTLHK